MDFWGKKINVSKAAAARQVAIINTFSSEKRFKIALDFANTGVSQTRSWIKSNHPEFGEKAITLEFVKLMHYEQGKMKEEHWQHFKSTMEELIRKEWTERFRIMMEANNWTYEDVAQYGGFKNGKVIEASISRGLPSFAKLAVVLFEQNLPISSTETKS